MYLTLSIKYKKLLRILAFILILNTYYLILTTKPVQAENINLKLSPSLITIQAIPPANPKVPITIENKGDNPENIKILLIPFRPSSKIDGQIEYPNTNAIPQSYKNIFEKIHLTDNGIITKNLQLGPKQKKELQLQFFILKEEPTADYYFSVVFLTSQNSNPPKTCQNSKDNTIPASPCSSAYSILNAGIAANVLLSIGPPKNPQGEITEFSAPQFLQSGPVPFTVRIKNSGPHVFAPIGRIFVKNIFGQTIGRIDLAPANILSDTSRSLTASSFARRSPSEGGTPTILWPEKFLLGPYTATLNLALSEQGPVYNKSIHFIAMPIQMTIGIIVTILIIIGIILRIRYRLKIDK
jgi:hypothetical protein